MLDTVILQCCTHVFAIDKRLLVGQKLWFLWNSHFVCYHFRNLADWISLLCVEQISLTASVFGIILDINLHVFLDHHFVHMLDSTIRKWQSRITETLVVEPQNLILQRNGLHFLYSIHDILYLVGFLNCQGEFVSLECLDFDLHLDRMNGRVVLDTIVLQCSAHIFFRNQWFLIRQQLIALGNTHFIYYHLRDLTDWICLFGVEGVYLTASILGIILDKDLHVFLYY